MHKIHGVTIASASSREKNPMIRSGEEASCWVLTPCDTFGQKQQQISQYFKVVFHKLSCLAFRNCQRRSLEVFHKVRISHIEIKINRLLIIWCNKIQVEGLVQIQDRANCQLVTEDFSFTFFGELFIVNERIICETFWLSERVNNIQSIEAEDQR